MRDPGKVWGKFTVPRKVGASGARTLQGRGSPTVNLGSEDWRPVSVLGGLTNGELGEYMRAQGAASEVLGAIDVLKVTGADLVFPRARVC